MNTVVEAPNFKMIDKSHENKWVAFSADYKKVIAVGNTLKSVNQNLGAKKGIVMKVLPFTGYVPRSK